MTEMAEFFNILIYGDASWLFLLVFVGFCFAFTYKYRWFAIFSITACLYQCINYASQVPTTSYMWHITLLIVGMCLMAMRLAKMI